jgi:hypothetical protein
MAGLMIPGLGRAAEPCPPPQVSLSGGTTATTNCTIVPSRSHSTTFPLTENPISEGGAWTGGDIFIGRTDVQTGNGNVYGTMINFDGANYMDSCAHLQGFGANHSITATIYNNGATNGLEIELLLRADITSQHSFAYELDCYWTGHGIALVRLDQTTANRNAFAILRNYVPNETPFNNGDQVYGSIVGTVITCRYKRTGGSWSTIFTYDTAPNGTKHSTGNPGVGFWNETGSSANNGKFAFSDFLAQTL